MVPPERVTGAQVWGGGVSVYYSDDYVTLYHGDSREILPTLPQADLCLTDPPYGIAGIWKGGFSSKHGWGKASTEAGVRNEWDGAAPDADLLALVLSSGRDAVIWGGNYFPLPPSRGWLIWNKPERNFSLAEAELAWTTRDMVIRVADLPRSEPGRQHPTQKPVALMNFCLKFFPKAKTVIDPFAGSGTTLVAAKGAGLKVVGIEAHEQYCEIIAKRCAQDVLDIFGGAA
jgi:site-specific DNA-methyltransferase (adenine-specific)